MSWLKWGSWKGPWILRSISELKRTLGRCKTVLNWYRNSRRRGQNKLERNRLFPVTRSYCHSPLAIEDMIISEPKIKTKLVRGFSHPLWLAYNQFTGANEWAALIGSLTSREKGEMLKMHRKQSWISKQKSETSNVGQVKEGIVTKESDSTTFKPRKSLPIANASTMQGSFKELTKPVASCGAASTFHLTKLEGGFNQVGDNIVDTCTEYKKKKNSLNAANSAKTNQQTPKY